VSRWRLRPLLELRRREADLATGALGRSLAGWRATEAEAAALRRLAAEVARQALAGSAAAGPAPAGLAGPGEAAAWPPGDAASLAVAAAGAARLRLESARLHHLAAEAEARAGAEAEVVESCRAGWRGAALRREVVERLEAAWRRARAVEAARRADAALDERPWSGGGVSASRPAGSRPAPARTGW